MSDTVQKIKERLNIVDVVQPYVKLAKAGKYWKGLSPFSKEKTPSFFVSPDRGLYHCFSSGKGGDMFTFIEEMEHVDFKGALRILAEKAGVEIERIDPAKKDERERLLAALESAKDFYQERLLNTASVREYLKERGVSDASVGLFEVGYAPREWQALHQFLTGKGYTELEIERAGLVKRPDGSEEKSADAPRFYDRFRGRIMFPIKDPSGRIIGFSGRIFEDDPKHPQAKYLNSPETPVFDKSRALYGLSDAREHVRSLGASILVEGQFDLIMCHQAGYRNAVATSGTAFSDEHAAILKRYAPNIVIAYDGDRAGIAAAGRAAQALLKSGMNVKIAALPSGADPADVIKANPQDFKDAVKAAKHVVEFYLELLRDAKYDRRTFRLEVGRTVLPYLSFIENRIDQAHFLQVIADALNVPLGAVTAELERMGSSNRIMSRAADAVPQEPFLPRAEAMARLVEGIASVFEERGEKELAEAAKNALSESFPKRAMDTISTDAAGLFEADLFLDRYEDEEKRGVALSTLYEELKRASVHEAFREALASLRRAEREKDSERADELLKDLQRIATMML